MAIYENKERDQTIYRMRFEEKLTLQEIADKFGVQTERIRQILAKIERKNDAEERRKAADPNTIGAMKLSTRLSNCLSNEGYSESTPVMTVLEERPLRKMMMLPNLGKVAIKEFACEAEKVVGAAVIRRWLKNAPLDMDSESPLEIKTNSKLYNRILYLEELLASEQKKVSNLEARLAHAINTIESRDRRIEVERSMNLELDIRLSRAEDFCLRLERFAKQNGDNFLLEKAREAFAELTGGKDE